MVARAQSNKNPKPLEKPQQAEAELVIEGGESEEEEFSHASAYRGRQDEKDYDKDPEFAEILGSYFDDPQKAQSTVLSSRPLLVCLFVCLFLPGFRL